MTEKPESDTATLPLPRRRFLAAVAVPGALAGCLVESEEPAVGTGGTDTESASEESMDDGSRTGQTDESGEADGTTDSGESSESSESSEPSESDDPDDPDDPDDQPTELGPEGSGLVVTDAEVRSVTDGGYETTVRARLTVENAGRFTYGTVEFRVDAYASRPGSDGRTAVGRAYVRERFDSGDRFDDGVRRFDAEISFRSGESRARADPTWYEVDAAIRRAEPV
ncbi:hypothetical protein [Halorubrum sp. DTA46]|uniref:hypothetical protein n=1 Tax=Halorubrum sp. DTA46 TaxID=3402162 RepID=UPI003AADBB6A